MLVFVLPTFPAKEQEAKKRVKGKEGEREIVCGREGERKESYPTKDTQVAVVLFSPALDRIRVKV